VRAIAVTLVLAAAALSLRCGGEGVCGDGNVDDGEQCDDGNADDTTDECLSDCTLRPIPQLAIEWEFNKSDELGFFGDNCIDLGAENVEVHFVGPGTDETKRTRCLDGEVKFRDMPAGMYSATVSVLDESDTLLTHAPVPFMLIFSGGVQEQQEVIVPPEAWTTAYLGNFFYRVSFADVSCEDAVPPVIQNTLLLEIDGVPYTGVTDAGHPVDGSAAVPCRSLMEPTAQAILDVPFGPATFTVQGLDATGAVIFESTTETFVGAGISNPELRFDCEAPVAPDAGADAS
jgi:hypothetical protein